jgi:tRNA1Val (adenine37-N6)-methyltransferase
MSNSYFRFKQFTINQNRCAMKVNTDGVLLGAWANIGDASQILDIGSGTGLITIMLAQRSEANISAVEIDKEAYLQSLENVKSCKWANRISIENIAFQQFAENNSAKFDLIVSNPPYFSNSLKNPDEARTLARHNDSLPPLELLAGVKKILNENGRFCVILPYVESQLFIIEATMQQLYCVRKTNIKSTSKKKPLRILMEFSFQREKLNELDLVIHDENGDYSSDFKTLTSEFYLEK